MIYLWLTWLCFPLLWLRAQWRLRARPTPQCIALIQTAKIGDFVCTTPLFRELKRRYPTGRLVVIGHGMNEPLARHNPHIDEFVALPPRGLRGFAGRRWLVRALASRRVDTSICVSPSLPAFIAPLWAGVARRLAVLPNYGGDSYRRAAGLLTQGEPHVAGRLLLDTEWRLLAALDIRPGRSDKEAWSAPDAHVAVKMLLAANTAPLVGLGASAGNKLKELGEARLRQLAQGILDRTSATLVLVGGPSDRELAAKVTAALPLGRVSDATGRFDLAALPALLQRLDVYVGVDSGITYLAEAAGVAVIDLMGPADADDQRPTGPHAVVIRTDLPCAPCSHAFRAPYTCKINTRACVLAAELDPVVEHVVAALQAREQPRDGR